MKSLIDELHNLDEYEYKVSPDFSKRVMKAIKKGKNANKISYVISLASFGVAACLAVIVCVNPNLLGRFGQKMESADNASNVEIVYYDGSENAAMEDISNNVKEDSTEINFDNFMVPEATAGLASDLKQNEYTDSMEVDSAINNKVEMLENLRTQNYDEVIKILKQANIEIEEKDDEIKAKATKEKVEELLKNYNNITIEEKGEYVIIK